MTVTMKKYRRIIAFCIAAAMLSVIIPTVYSAEVENVIFSYDFESDNIGDKPQNIECGSGSGKISVENGNGGRVLSLKNNTDGAYVGITKKFEKVKEGAVAFEFDFMQPDCKADYNKIISLYNDGEEVLSVITEGEQIRYKIRNDKYETVLSDYAVNRWYSFKLNVNVTDKTADVYVDGERKCVGLKLANYVSNKTGVNEYRAGTAYSPGFMLDNIKAGTSDVLGKIEINGKDSITIPKQGEVYSERYDVLVKNGRGNVISNDEFYAELSPPITGVTIEKKGGSVIVYVAENAQENASFELIVTANADSGISARKTITVLGAVETEVKIKGNAKLTTVSGEEYLFNFSAEIFDQLGRKTDDSEVYWSLSDDAPSGIWVDDNGTVHVTGEMKRDAGFKIIAESKKSGIKGEKNLVMLDRNTYLRDKARLDAVVEWADNVMEKGRDVYNGSPLFANGIDRFSDELFSWEFKKSAENPEQPVLASYQGGIYSSFEAISALTGDEKYKDRVDEIIKWWIENGSSPGGLIYTGSHASINLKTGKKQYGDPEKKTFEVTDTNIEPMYEIDPDFASKFVKAHWASRVTDWSNLNYSRHGHIQDSYDFENTWEKTSQYNGRDLSLIWDIKNIPFSYAGVGMISDAGKMYKYTKDEKALFWSRSMLERFMANKNKDTNLFCARYTRQLGHPDAMDPMVMLKPYGAWWLADPLPEYYTGLEYGDRFYNNYGDDLIKQGFVKSEDREQLQDCYYFADGRGDYGEYPLLLIEYANNVGIDTEWGKSVMDYLVRGCAAYSKYGYNKETNDCNQLLSNGTSLTGFQSQRNGYYGRAGRVISTVKAYEQFFVTDAKLYIYCMNNPGYENEMKYLWDMISGEAMGWGLGNIGDTKPGENMDVDLNTSYSHPWAVMGLCDLYKATGIHEYLDLARTIADNCVKNNYKDKLFSRDYNNWTSFQNIYTNSLLYLEQTICRAEGIINAGFGGVSGFDAWGMYENGAYIDKNATYKYFQTSLPYVSLRDFKLEKTEVTLETGESEEVNVIYIPSDASGSMMYDTSDGTVAYAENDIIYAVGNGETVIRCTAPGAVKRTVREIKVTVK